MKEEEELQQSFKRLFFSLSRSQVVLLVRYRRLTALRNRIKTERKEGRERRRRRHIFGRRMYI